MYQVTCKGSNCNQEDFFRANGNVPCPTCRKPYKSHPFCANNELPESMQSSSKFRDYHLNVLCNGDHVHC